MHINQAIHPRLGRETRSAKWRLPFGLATSAVARHMAICFMLIGGIPLISTTNSAAAVLSSLAPFLVNHYTFDDPLDGDLQSPVELDQGLDATNIQLVNGAPRVLDGAWWGSQYSLETRQNNVTFNDDCKAGVMFSTSAASTLTGTQHVSGVTIMGWFKPLGTADDNPSPKNPANPNDRYNAFGLAGLLRGDENVASLDGHAVRALLEVINGKVTGLGRRLDNQGGSGSRVSVANWYEVLKPGEWTHLTATFDFDNGTIDLYRNGLTLNSAPASTGNWATTSGVDFTSDSAAGGIKIGGSHPDNSAELNPFNGRSDEIMFFNKWLSSDEVEAQFQLVSNIPGDYNRNGRVDAADYTMWRDTLGARGAGLLADGNGDEEIDMGDYTIWSDNFGFVAGNAALRETSLPEPSGVALVLSAVALLAVVCPASRRRYEWLGNQMFGGNSLWVA